MSHALGRGMVGTLRSILSRGWEQAGGRSNRSNQLRRRQRRSPQPNHLPRRRGGPASAPTTLRCGDRARGVDLSRMTRWSTISMSASRVLAQAARRPVNMPWRCCCCGSATRWLTRLHRHMSAPGLLVGRPSGQGHRAQLLPAAQDQNQQDQKRSKPEMRSVRANQRNQCRSPIATRLATIVSNGCTLG
jgi:hypothetical protein